MDPVTTDMPLPPGRQRKKAPPARRPLDYAQIVDAALKVVDAEGMDGLSMRRVAQELGTGAASLYAHVQNKEELVDAVVDQVIGEVEMPPPGPEGGDWRAEFVELAHATRAALAAHRDVARGLWGRVPTGPNALLVSERCFGVLRRIGLPDQMVGWAGPLLFDYITMDVYEGSLYAERFGDDATGIEYFTSVFRYFASLPPDRFPTIVAMAEAITTGDDHERFAFGLNVLLAGLAAQVPPGQEPGA